MKKDYVIGISAYYHDSSACLFKNGKLLFACEEEKFTGIKHDSSFPHNVLKFIIKTYRLDKDNIDAVCYYEDPKLKLKRVLSNSKKNWFKSPIFTIKSILNSILTNRKVIKEIKKYSDNIFFSTHHKSHAYYSFYTSNFKTSTCLSIDGVGEFETTTFGEFSLNDYKHRTIAEYPHSLGLYYSAMTAFLGFKPNEGEYKVMGLAPYGKAENYIDKVRKLIYYSDDELVCNMEAFCWDRSSKNMFTYKLSKILNLLPRGVDDKINTEHEDLAAAVQQRYEEVLFSIINTLPLFDENNNLCISGGCAYNGTANGKITEKTKFKSLWIPLAPSDAGSCIGACINYLVNNGKLTEKVNKNPFIGPIYNFDKYLPTVRGVKIFRISSSESLVRIVAKKINEGKVIGWYQGHIEFGARALGNRSILANPTIPNMKDRINKLIKKREGFRPFAPMVTKESQNIFFEMDDDVPYMNQIVKVKPKYMGALPAITHVDGSARVQTVYRHTLIHNLLLEFEKLSGVPILLNTSFNIKDKTMVLTPKDAIDTFKSTEMDILVMGNYIIYKT